MAVKVAVPLAALLFCAMPMLIRPAAAQQRPEPAAPAEAPPAAFGAAPAPFKPDAAAAPDVWIFSGELQGSHESFSGTLVADGGGKDGSTAQFELKLGDGATCDGSNVSGEVGLVRLNEVTCTDDRVMRALFVPQGGGVLKVFGHVGDERFAASAHLLGTEAAPEKGQTAQPTAPKLQRPALPAPPPGAEPPPPR